MSLRAERLMALESPAELKARIRVKPRITNEVMESIKRDVLKRLKPLDRGAQQQRGLTKSLARMKVR